MRASACASAAALTLTAALAFAQASPAFGQASPAAPSKVGSSALDPAFRLPSGGRALAGPLVDSIASPNAAWLLSEDLALYALTDSGKLAARIDLSAGSDKPAAFLALDPFGRVIVARGGRLVAYTRMGSKAWSAVLESTEGLTPPAFGSDGRAFIVSGRSLACVSPSGQRLWRLELPAAAACPPSADGYGRPCVGLADGSLLIATPYGEKVATVKLGSVPEVLCPLVAVSAKPGGGASAPVLAAGLADGSLLFLGPKGEVMSSARLSVPALSLAWDGEVLYGLGSGGEAFAYSASGSKLWSISTGCSNGSICLFPERVVAVGKGRAVSLSRKGEVFREMTVPGAAGVVAVSPAGLAFCPGADWVLAAYRFELPLGAPIRIELPAYGESEDFVTRELRFNPLASDADNQLIRIADIEKSLRSGTIGKDEPADAAYCSAVATRAFDRDLPDIERRRSGNPLARSQACYLLGEFGSLSYRDALFRVLEADTDPAVRAAACDALSSFGVDPDGRSMSAFLAAAARPVDERTALVIVEAIESMALRSGQAPSEDGLRALIKLTTTSYGQNVRSRAQTALGRISGTID